MWSIIEEKHICFAPYFPKSLIGINPLAEMTQFTNDQFRIFSKSELEDTYIEGIRMLRDYFAMKFISDEKYSISSYIAYRLMYNTPLYNTVILYPSLKTDYKHINYAIHPNFVDENMKLERVYRLTVKNVNKYGDENFKIDFKLYKTILFNLHSTLKEADTSADENREKFKKVFKEDFGFEPEI